LYDCRATIKLELVTGLEIATSLPVGITDEMASIIIYHYPLIECVILEDAILPTFLLSFEVMGEETNKVNHSGSCRSQVRSHDPR
jgi:hypothetical protein